MLINPRDYFELKNTDSKIYNREYQGEYKGWQVHFRQLSKGDRWNVQAIASMKDVIRENDWKHLEHAHCNIIKQIDEHPYTKELASYWGFDH
jgi:hypothetical protein